MEEALRALLLGSASVSAIAGNRINWGAIPQGATGPTLVLFLISGAERHHMQGPDGLLEARVQIDCRAASYADAKQLSRAVITLLDGYRGGNFQGVFHAGTRDGREGGTNEADRPFYVQLDFLTYWSNRNG